MAQRLIAADDQSSDAKVFAQLRERAGKVGHNLTRASDQHGVYLASCWGMTRRFEKIEQLAVFVDLVTGAIDARVAGSEH